MKMIIDRRAFVGSAMAAGAAGLAASAGAVRAARGTLEDVRHVVILMQENRSFDHYFGTLGGVRGFGDRRAIRLPGGTPVWAQRQDDRDGGAIVRPFHLDTRATAAGCITSLDHSWKGSHDRWKHWDVWMPEKGPFSMGYLTRDDIPYYHALADRFTICDAYHASIHGPTGPNRLFHFSGTSGNAVGVDGAFNVTNDGVDANPGADMAKDDSAFAGLPWPPYAMRLDAAGVSWRVYQEYDNFSDNPLGYFTCFRGLDRASRHYRRARAWVPGSSAVDAETSRADHLVAAFAADVAVDGLPQVSWIVAPFHMCEHPDAPPAYGETLTARLIAALAAQPAVWAKTAFILNYDENDGFFDHMPPPVPPTRPGMGQSDIDLRGEVYRGEPIGLGARVPLIVVSPWTRGGWVNSQLSDHTSVLRFLERRFGVAEPNISPWRRAVCGDLVSMFDFDVDPAARLDTSWAAELPGVGDAIARSDHACRLSAPVIPMNSSAVRQEPGTRPARALPYAIDVLSSWSTTGLALRFVNRGPVAVTFAVAEDGGRNGPWHYTVAPGSEIVGDWPHMALTVSGPNGFHRAYADADGWLAARVERRGDASVLTIANAGATPAAIVVHSAYHPAPVAVMLEAGATWQHPFAMPGHRWYDLTITRNGQTVQALAGHFEDGTPDISEPPLFA